jgi:2-keto-3-deoxy-L-rhamnonate aldolase RhmA
VGDRGWDPTAAAYAYGNRRRDPDPPRFLVQIETENGLADAEKIARVTGVTDLFVGPADLSLALGESGQLFGPEVVNAVEALPQRINGTGVRLGLFVDSPARAAWAAGIGYSFLAIGADVALLSTGSAQKVSDARAAIDQANPARDR